MRNKPVFCLKCGEPVSIAARVLAFIQSSGRNVTYAEIKPTVRDKSNAHLSKTLKELIEEGSIKRVSRGVYKLNKEK